MLNRNDKGARAANPQARSDAQQAARVPAPQVARRVRLDEIDRADLRYFLRDEKALSEASLKGLMASLQHEGVQDPVEFFRDGDRKVLVKGFLRVAACAILARKGAEGFRDDMELDAIEVLETDHRELLIRSVLDNSVRKSLDQVDRIRAARSLFLANVIEGRAAEALGISVQSYKRDLLIAENPWMFDRVVANEVNPTPASTILRAIADAEKEHPGIRSQVRGELHAWVEAKRLVIERRDKVLKAKKGRGRGLSEADRQVKRYLSNQLAEHWAELIRRGESLDDTAEWTFQVDLDPEKDLLQIGGVRLNLAKDPARKLAEVASKLSQLAKDLGPFLKKRFQEEQLQRMRSSGRTFVRDTQYLRDLGLDGLAAQFEQELQDMEQAGPDGEEDPDYEGEDPRAERDLAAEADADADAPGGRDSDADPDDEGGAR